MVGKLRVPGTLEVCGTLQGKEAMITIKVEPCGNVGEELGAIGAAMSYRVQVHVHLRRMGGPMGKWRRGFSCQPS